MSVKSLAMSAAGYEPPLAIEDVFSTYLYTGNGSTQTINNGIDLAGKGGMVWIKDRTYNGNQNYVQDTVRGITNALVTNSTAASATANVSSANGTGFTLNNTYVSDMNYSGLNLISWTFRKAPKFFDVVTFTGNTTFNHSLGATPGMIVIKSTGIAQDWWVWHRSLGNSSYVVMNTMAASAAFSNWCVPTSTSVTVSGLSGGATYVAYLFAHDTTTDGLIQCGSFTTNVSPANATVSLGWEPQYVMMKRSDGAENWRIYDNMRGMGYSSARELRPNTSDAETNFDSFNVCIPNATGFTTSALSSGGTYIYMAIRRGPMRTPTDGTKVFSPIAVNNAAGTTNTTGFPIDTQIITSRGVSSKFFASRLIGVSSTTTASGVTLASTSSAAEEVNNVTQLWNNDGFQTYPGAGGASMSYWNFRRAPGFFDVVCYTGTGANLTVNHNLGVAPELMIVKRRDSATTGQWYVYNSKWSNSSLAYSMLNSDGGRIDGMQWNLTDPTSSVFSVGTMLSVSSGKYIAYLFASCPGVSKVGSYTGNGTNQTINCGFSAGARFILIKRTDSTGDWYVWDTARGIVAATDPHLSLNGTAAEVTTDDSIDPDSTGFIVNQVAATNINVNAATYIYLAIA